MHKGIVLLKRPKGTSVEAFREWWLGSHLNYSRQRPEVLKYTGSFTVAPAAGSPYTEGEPAYDMLVEFWCKDRETVENVFNENFKAGGVADSLKHAGVRIAFIAEEHVIVDRTQE
jgi:hypothetical protein